MDYIWTSLSAVQKAVKHNHSLTRFPLAVVFAQSIEAKC